MTNPAAPNYRTGKVCYLEMPATDVSASARFYERAFGWRTRERGDGSMAFDDTTGEVSGTWVLGRAASGDTGIRVSIMVADAAAACAAIVAAGGAVLQPANTEETEVYAVFSDPAGNVLTVYQQPGLAEREREMADALR